LDTWLSIAVGRTHADVMVSASDLENVKEQLNNVNATFRVMIPDVQVAIDQENAVSDDELNEGRSGTYFIIDGKTFFIYAIKRFYKIYIFIPRSVTLKFKYFSHVGVNRLQANLEELPSYERYSRLPRLPGTEISQYLLSHHRW